MCSTLKVNTSSKIVLGSPTKFAGLTQKRKEIIGIPNQSIRTKFFAKKVYLVP
jgi:hypothetical protein